MFGSRTWYSGVGGSNGAVSGFTKSKMAARRRLGWSVVEISRLNFPWCLVLRVGGSKDAISNLTKFNRNVGENIARGAIRLVGYFLSETVALSIANIRRTQFVIKRIVMVDAVNSYYAGRTAVIFFCWCFCLSFLFSPPNFRARSVDRHQKLPLALWWNRFDIGL